MSREAESGTCSGTSSSDDQMKELNKSIRREVAKLSDKWSSLLAQTEQWQRKLDDTLPVSLGHLYYPAFSPLAISR